MLPSLDFGPSVGAKSHSELKATSRLARGLKQTARAAGVQLFADPARALVSTKQSEPLLAELSVQAQHLHSQDPGRAKASDVTTGGQTAKLGAADLRERYTRLDVWPLEAPESSDPDNQPSTSYRVENGLSQDGAAQRSAPGPRLLHKRAKRAQSSGRLREALDAAYAGLEQAPDDAALLALAASLESKLGNAKQAAGLLERGLQEDPDNVALLTAMAGVECSQRNFDAARELYRTALVHEPRNAVVLQALGCLETQLRNYGSAVSRFQAAAKADPDMISTYTAWARLEARVGNTDQARGLFQEGARADGRDVHLLHAWAVFEMDQARMSAARKLLEQALAHNPGHVPSWMSLGRLEWHLSNYTKAREVFEEGVLQLSACVDRQASAQLLHAWAQLELGSKNIKQARDLFERIRSFAPQHLHTLQSEAQMEDRAGNAARSDALYTAAEQLASNSPHVLHARVQQRLRQGDLDGAEATLQALEAADPGNGYLAHTRGIMAQAQGDMAAAAEWFKRGTQAEGDEPALLNWEGLAELLAFQGHAAAASSAWQAGSRGRRLTSRYLRQWALAKKKREGDDAAAATLFSAAVRANPQDYKSWLSWAVFERGRRNIDAAERCFQSCVLVAPNNPHLWVSYATMLCSVGRYEDARGVFQQGTRQCPRCGPLWMEYALLEWKLGQMDAARALFKHGSQVPASYQHLPLYEAWTQLERVLGDEAAAVAVMEVQAHVKCLLAVEGKRVRRPLAAPAVSPSGEPSVPATGQTSQPDPAQAAAAAASADTNASGALRSSLIAGARREGQRAAGWQAGMERGGVASRTDGKPYKQPDMQHVLSKKGLLRPRAAAKKHSTSPDSAGAAAVAPVVEYGPSR